MAIRPADHGIFASAAGGGAVAGYWCGGTYDRTYRIAFADDTKSQTTSMPAAKIGGGGYADSGVAGYASAGYNSSWARTDINYKMAMPAETWSTITALPNVRSETAGMANSGVAGYTLGGGQGPGAYYTNTIYKNAFPDNTISTLSATLSVVRNNAQGFANFGVKGYLAGGHNGSTYVTTTDTLSFPGETRSTTTAVSDNKNHPGGFASNAQAGYVGGGMGCGGDGACIATAVDKFAFSDDSRSALSSGLSVATYALGGFANSTVAGYVGGGYTTTYIASGSKWTFPSDTRSDDAAMLGIGMYYIAAFADEGVL